MGQKIIKQLPSDNISTIFPDVFICSSGYESRASNIATLIECSKVKYKFAICFTDQTGNKVRKENDKIFWEKDFVMLDNDKDDQGNIKEIIKKIVELTSEGSVKVLVDYSSMSRTWIASLINCSHHNIANIEYFFAYSCAVYNNPVRKSPSISFDPIPGFNNLSIPDKPTALIIGLGNEPERAAGLIEYFDAREVYLFHTDNDEYLKSIESANENLLKQVDANHIIAYPLLDLEYTFSILSNLCLNLSDDYRIIIAPLGPKPFSVMSLIVAMNISNIDIWRISGENNAHLENRVSTNDVLLFKLRDV